MDFPRGLDRVSINYICQCTAIFQSVYLNRTEDPYDQGLKKDKYGAAEADCEVYTNIFRYMLVSAR